jgi:hypothetical protein
MSGISLSAAQSPPPMTLPARAVAIAVWSGRLKNAWRYDAVTSSLQALLLE